MPSDPSRDYYYILRETGKTEPLLIEYGFLDSPGDDVNQLKNNLLDLAEGVVMAVTEYAGYPYVAVSGSNVYVVKKGDSLYSIANKYNTTVDELKLLNNLTTNNLAIGQIIKLPSADVDTNNIYVVKNGDSLWKISQMYGISVDDLINANNLSDTTLQIGQTLKIPTEGEEIENGIDSVYTVKSGDTLWNIAKKYNVSVDELKAYNNLSSNLLSIGQQLYIPVSANTYIVQKGDTLYSIAGKYNTTVNQLKQANNLTSNILTIGQSLLIP